MKTFNHFFGLRALCRSVLLAAFAALTACGGGTTSDTSNGSVAPISVASLRPLPTAFSGIAVNYSPFRTATSDAGRDTEVITAAMVDQDLDLLVTAGVGLIRLFDSSDKVAKLTLSRIQVRALPIKVQLGAFVSTYARLTDPVEQARIRALNDDEIARCINLANSFKNEVVSVSIGNETQVSWSFVPISSVELAAFIRTVRSQIQQPITTDDNWAPFAGFGRSAGEQIADVLKEVDYVSIHTYPMLDAQFSNFSDNDPKPDWDWEQLGVDPSVRASAMMDAAIGKAQKDYSAARKFMDSIGRSNLPIVIGETGWMATDPTGGKMKFFANAANQKMYYARLLDWANASRNNDGPKGIVYFEAFDEPWKQADDKWGLFDVGRKARCAAQALNPTATWSKDPASCLETAAVFFAPPVPNPALTATKLIIHDENTTGFPIGIDPMRADAFDVFTFNLTYPSLGDSSASDQLVGNLAGSHFIKIDTFTPKNYGWGYLWQSSNVPAKSVNMSNFANGSINFSVKTSYAGKLRIGISSETVFAGTVEANLLVSNGDTFGYCTNSPAIWCDVRIPLSAFQAANPLLDLRFVLTRLSIADIYSETGNTARSGMPEIRLDNIFWAQ